MPLRDHFRPPLDNRRHWEGFHVTWPVMIVSQLRHRLPPGFFAEPRVHSGRSAEIDVATFEDDRETDAFAGEGGLALTASGNGPVASAVWAPPRPTLAVAADLPAQDVYEVQIYDERRHCRLVAAIEIVSPANKDRAEHRRAFAAKCASLLRERISVVIVDVVTTRSPNLYAELLDLIGRSDPAIGAQPPALYTSACRFTKHDGEWMLETWTHALEIGRPLPTMPLWLADDRAIPLELEESYEQSCKILGVA